MPVMASLKDHLPPIQLVQCMCPVPQWLVMNTTHQHQVKRCTSHSRNAQTHQIICHGESQCYLWPIP